MTRKSIPDCPISLNILQRYSVIRFLQDVKYTTIKKMF